MVCLFIYFLATKTINKKLVVYELTGKEKKRETGVYIQTTTTTTIITRSDENKNKSNIKACTINKHPAAFCLIRLC